MSKNTNLIPADILEVLGPAPLVSSEDPKRWNETLARYARSSPPKSADDFEGWKAVWNLTCDDWEEERMKRFKVESLEAPYRAKLKQELQARADKIEDALRTEALDRALAEFRRSRLGLELNEKLPAETKGPGAEADPKLSTEGQTIPAVTSTERAPLLPPPTVADHAAAFAENMHIYYCADQIQNSARKRYDAVRNQLHLRRAAELASKVVNAEVTFTSTQLLEAPNLPEPQQSSSSVVSTLSAVKAAIAVGETSGSASSPQLLEAPNLPQPQDLSEASIGSTPDATPVADLSAALGETTKVVSSHLEAPDSSEPQESAAVSTASAMGVPPAIEPSTAVGEADMARVPPGRLANNVDNNVAADSFLATPPAARERSPRRSIISTAVTTSNESVLAGAPMPDGTPAAQEKDEGDCLLPPAALVQPSQQHGVHYAQVESNAERIAARSAWVLKEKAWREAKRVGGRAR